MSTISRHESSRTLIVFVHGLMRTSMSMKPLGHYLERQGYAVDFYSYISARGSIHEHSADLNHYLQKLLAKHQFKKIYIVTHSLGGIIARDALAQLSQKQLRQVDGLIMLAPPNQGSSLAQVSLRFLPILSYFVKPLPELSSKESATVHKIPIPKVPIGIIAGRYDAKVRPDATRLEGQNDPVLVNSTHTFIMYNSQTKILVSNFIKYGRFNK